MHRAALLLLAVAAAFTQPMSADAVPIIYDTDMTGDVDDVGALAILNKLANLGEANMLAVVTNNGVKGKSIGGCIKAINTYYGNPAVPIGTYRGAKYAEMADPYDSKVKEEFAKDTPPDDQLPTALHVYRTTLNAAADDSVTIVSVGFMVNLRELLESPADADSPFAGIDLVKRKVKKLVVMGGAYPAGQEWNFSGNGVGPETAMAVEKWPTPILFSGVEIGQGITTGVRIKSSSPHNPVRRAYELYNNFSGRSSWDLTAVLAAVRDPKFYWDIKEDGYNQVGQDGKNVWSPTPNRGHSYLVTRVPQTDMGLILDNLMTLPPGPSR